MDAAGQLARDRGIATLGITVGLSGEYGPAQRLYGRRGYGPDGRGACQGRRPLRTGMLVTLDDDLIIWLTRHLPGRELSTAPQRHKRPGRQSRGAGIDPAIWPDRHHRQV